MKEIKFVKYFSNKLFKVVTRIKENYEQLSDRGL